MGVRERRRSWADTGSGRRPTRRRPGRAAEAWAGRHRPGIPIGAARREVGLDHADRRRLARSGRRTGPMAEPGVGPPSRRPGSGSGRRRARPRPGASAGGPGLGPSSRTGPASPGRAWQAVQTPFFEWAQPTILPGGIIARVLGRRAAGAEGLRPCACAGPAAGAGAGRAAAVAVEAGRGRGRRGGLIAGGGGRRGVLGADAPRGDSARPSIRGWSERGYASLGTPFPNPTRDPAPVPVLGHRGRAIRRATIRRGTSIEVPRPARLRRPGASRGRPSPTSEGRRPTHQDRTDQPRILRKIGPTAPIARDRPDRPERRGVDEPDPANSPDWRRSRPRSDPTDPRSPRRMNLYLAGPLFTQAERSWNLRLAALAGRGRALGLPAPGRGPGDRDPRRRRRSSGSTSTGSARPTRSSRSSTAPTPTAGRASNAGWPSPSACRSSPSGPTSGPGATPCPARSWRRST